MKPQLIAIVAAVVLVGCGPPKDICEAAKQGDIRAVKLFIAAGADVNAKDSYGYTPLHRAAYDRQKEIAELLIAKGADVNAKNEDGETPLDWAINFKKTENADLLRKHGGKTGAELEAAGK